MLEKSHSLLGEDLEILEIHPYLFRYLGMHWNFLVQYLGN
jgi:hypothetical protein